MINKKYLNLQLKRSLKIYPSILLVTLVTVIGIALVAGVLVHGSINSSDKKKLRIGIVGDTSESYLGVGITALKELDNSRYAIELIETDKEYAERAVRSGEFSGYLSIPEGFLHDIWTGKNTPAEYVVLNDTTGFETVLMSEVASVVSEWVIRAQNTVSSLDSVVMAEGTPEQKKKIDTHIMNINFINLESILSRNEVYETKTIGISDYISLEGYYVCGVLMFFMLIWGVSCNKLLIRTNYALPRSLCARGIKSAEQVFCEYAGYLCITLITAFGGGFLLGIAMVFSDFGIIEFQNKNLFDCLIFVIKLVPVIVMITVMQIMMYELVPGTVNSVVLQLFVAVAFAYVSGCFYPNYFFPSAVEKFGAVLPSGVGMTYIRKCMRGDLTFGNLGAVIMYIVVFMSIAVFTRKQSLAGDER